MAAMGAIPADALNGFTVLGELALDGSITLGRRRAARRDGGQWPRTRADLPAMPAAPRPPGHRSDLEILAPRTLIQLANHFKGTQV